MAQETPKIEQMSEAPTPQQETMPFQEKPIENAGIF